MSRTDKDDPYYVITFRSGEICHDHRHDDCDVVTLEDLKAYRHRREQPSPTKPCDRWLSWRWFMFDTYDRQLAKQWYSSDRARIRDEVKDAVKLANAGEMDDGFDIENRQHRHGAAWYL